jgi:hydrogenase maturation factor
MAISIVDEAEAHRVFDYLNQMNELGELNHADQER